MVSWYFSERNGGLRTDDRPRRTEGAKSLSQIDSKFGGLRWRGRCPSSVVWRLAEGWEVLTAEIAEITEMEMGGKRNFFPRISRSFTDGRWKGAKSFYPQISQISTDGKWVSPGISK